MTGALEVFCDESGYTGPDLLNVQQPHFVYAAVAMPAGEAAELVARVRRDNLIARPELKASELVRTARGRTAIQQVLEACEGRFCFVLFQKTMGLCGKVFEYLYEPVLEHAAELAYARFLHRFVCMFGFVLSQGGDPVTLEVLRQFQAFMRKRDPLEAPLLFSSDATELESPYSIVTRFARGYRDLIFADRRAAERSGDPALDLSVAGLWSILTRFGELGTQLAVTCDHDPLAQSVAARMAGGSSDPGVLRARQLIAGADVSEYELARPIVFADSRTSPGLQLADLIAGVATATVNGRVPRESMELLSGLLEPGCHHRHSVTPEMQWVDLAQREPKINWMVLMELANLADEGVDPRGALPGIYRMLERLPVEAFRAAYD